MGADGRLTSLSVQNFKSVGAVPAGLRIRPLTLLAGPNSSGKSTMLQPLLLLKQTYDSTFNPGSLLLDGANVRISEVPQMLSLIPGANKKGFRWGFETDGQIWTRFEFEYDRKPGLRTKSISGEDQSGVIFEVGAEQLEFRPGRGWGHLGQGGMDLQSLMANGV